MKKKIIMMAGAFIAGAATVTGIRHYLVKQEKERLALWDEDYEDEDEEEIDDFGFDEDLDDDFKLDEERKAQIDKDTLEEVVEYMLDNRSSLTDAQVQSIIRALNLRRVEILTGVGRKCDQHE